MKKLILLFILGLFIALPSLADSKLELVKFRYDAKGNDNYNLNDEYVVLKNISEIKLNLRKWKVIDNDKHKLVLPKIILKKNQKIKIFTGEGDNKIKKKLKVKKVYWGNRWGLWNNDGDVLNIKNRNNKLVIKYEY